MGEHAADVLTGEHTADVLDPATGGRSEGIRAARERWVSRAVSHATDVVVERGRGALVWDVDGRRYIDFAGGIGTLNVGHAHPAVTGAIVAQASRMSHVCFSVALYEPYVRLAERLAAITPGTFAKKTVLVNSGAEAVENAVKVARAATGRPYVVAFTQAFHGRTHLALSLTAKEHPYKAGFGPYSDQVLRVPQPYPYRPHFPGDEVRGCLDALAAELEAKRGQVAAILFEPVQGESGFIVPPAEWVRGMADLGRRHGCVLIADEVQTGFGRTGRWFAVEHADIEPDLVIMAKSLAGGLPLGAVTGRAELMDAPQVGGLGGTFGGNPIACAAALAVIEVIRGSDLVRRAETIGERIRARFDDLARRCSMVGEVRGLGAMVALELVRDPRTKEPAAAETAAVVRRAAERGLLLIRAGIHDNVVRVLVPLVVTDDELDEGLGILASTIDDMSVGGSA